MEEFNYIWVIYLIILKKLKKKGLLKKRCFDPMTGIPHEDNIICGRIECPSEYICGKMIANPNWGVTNFDNLAYAFLMVF